MVELFSIERLIQKELSLMVEKDGRVVEIMFAGSAFRKTFSMLVLLYSLIATPGKYRILLIEELESQLYPTLQHKLLCIVERLTSIHKIQLLLASNSDQVMKIFSKV